MRVASPALALALVALSAPAVSGLFAAPAGAAPDRAAQTDACKQALNPDRRTVYRFTNGAKSLGFARVIVTATKSDRHTYCIRLDFGKRTPRLYSSSTSYVRRDGQWINEGGAGDGTPSPVGSHTLWMKVQDKRRIGKAWGIRYQGKDWNTIVISRYNL